MKRTRIIVAMVLSLGLMIAAIGSASAAGTADRATVKTKVEKNKKNGTAKITANVSTAGKLKIKGSKIKSAKKTVNAAGKTKIKVKPKGKTKKKLKKKGKAKVKVKLVFTPANGGPDDPYDPYVPANNYDPYNPNDPVVKKKIKITLKLKGKSISKGGK